MPTKSRLSTAFQEGFNLIGLASTVAVSAALLNPVPLFAALVAEAAYLLFVPDTKWYDDRLSKKFDAEIERKRRQTKQKVFPLLRPELQRRFTQMETMRGEIGTMAHGEETWFREVLRKLDYLLDKYLAFAGQEAQFRRYLTSVLGRSTESDARNDTEAGGVPPLLEALFPQIFKTPAPQQVRPKNRSSQKNTPPKQQTPDPVNPEDRWVTQTVQEIQARYTDEIDEVKRTIEAQADPETKSVLDKRLDILQRRQEFVAKIGKILINLNHQLQLLEDTFGLINDEIRARPPEQLLSDIDDVVLQTDSMTQALNEMATFQQTLST